MKNRNIIYIVITVICVFAIIMAVYYQIFKTDNKNTNTVENNVGNNEIIDNRDNPQVIRDEFYGLFNNILNAENFDDSNIEKYDNDKKILYSVYEVKEEKENKYSLSLNLPAFNIKDTITNEYNQTTQNIFVNKANEILAGVDEYVIYNVDYTAYVNNNIVSLVIKSTLKEGNNAQRVIVQTYNYNLETKEKVTLNSVLESKNISKEIVNAKIEEQVTFANEQAIAIAQALGKTVYQRDLQNAMYLTDNVSNFFIGENGAIYIVYAYGNANFTSELDVVKIM